MKQRHQMASVHCLTSHRVSSFTRDKILHHLSLELVKGSANQIMNIKCTCKKCEQQEIKWHQWCKDKTHSENDKNTPTSAGSCWSINARTGSMSATSCGSTLTTTLNPRIWKTCDYCSVFAVQHKYIAISLVNITSSFKLYHVEKTNDEQDA